MKTLNLLIGLLLLLSGSEVWGQRRESYKKVPAAITEYIHIHYPAASNIAYFREVNKDTLFIECTFKYQKDKYTLKFQNDTLFKEGVHVLFREIPSDVQLAIQSTLRNLFSQYRILETQEINPHTNPFYEIRVKGRTEKTDSFYDIYFNKKGEFVSKREIILEPISSEI